MAVHMIVYDLQRQGQKYPEIDKKIQSITGKYWRILESTWIVQTDLTAVQVREMISPLTDANDKLVVVRLSGEAAWKGFGDEGNSWLSDVLKAA